MLPRIAYLPAQKHTLPIVLLLVASAAVIAAAIAGAAPAVHAVEHPNQIETVLRGAESGDAAMQYRLAMWKFWALPQQRDVPGALRLFCLAARQGHAPAQTHLGLMYWTGSGVPRDSLQAYLWFHLAAQQGGQAAAEHRDRLGRDHLAPAMIQLAIALAERWQHSPSCPVQIS